MEISQVKDDRRKVTFAVRAPFAKEVILIGDFNNWDSTVHSLERDDDGLWKVTLRLSPGEYEYKLQVDGQWWEDIRDEKTIRNRFGTLNRVIVVPEKTQT